MRPDTATTCPLCWLQSRPTVLFSAAVGVFVLVLVGSLAGLLV
jgi:hypothetical protein